MNKIDDKNSRHNSSGKSEAGSSADKNGKSSKNDLVGDAMSKANQYLDIPKNKIQSVPGYSLVRDFINRFGRYRVTGRAAEISYYLMLAIFPFIIFLISLFGVIGSSTLLHQDILNSLEGLIPDAVFSILDSIISEIAASQNVTILSAGMIGLMWASSKGFSVILRGLNHIYRTGKPISGFILRLLGLVFALLLVISIMLTMALITFGDLLFEQLAYWTGLDFLSGNLLQAGRYAVSFLFLIIIFSLIYYLVSGRKCKYRWSLPPAVFAAVFWIFVSLAFSWYLNNFNRYTTLYGSIGGVMILMLWLYVCSIMILTGGIIHEMIIERKNLEN
jgi:membrane protein